MGHPVGRAQRQPVEDDLASMFDFIYEFAPQELAAWTKEVRATMNGFQPWRSREVLWLKPRKNGKNEDIDVSKDGKVYPAETIKQRYEKLPSSGTAAPTGRGDDD